MNMEYGATISNWLLAMSVCVLTGLIIAVVTSLIVGHAAWHLPGKSVGAGYSCAWCYKYKPAWLRFLIFAVSGFIGWLVFIWCFR